MDRTRKNDNIKETCLDIIEPPVDATIAPEKPKKTGGPDVRIPVRR